MRKRMIGLALFVSTMLPSSALAYPCRAITSSSSMCPNGCPPITYTYCGDQQSALQCVALCYPVFCCDGVHGTYQACLGDPCHGPKSPSGAAMRVVSFPDRSSSPVGIDATTGCAAR
jgi:hypothetical protein